MPSRGEIFRRELREADSPLSRHSTSSHELKNSMDGQKKLEHVTLGTRIQQRRAAREEESKARHQEFLDNLGQYQFDRALGNIREGRGSNEDVIYVATKYATRGNIDAAHVIMRLVDPETLLVERYPDPINWNMNELDPVSEIGFSSMEEKGA